jgi:hypothetical protein
MVFIDLKVDFENSMFFDKLRDAILLASFSILYDLFSRLMVFLACDKMSQESFCSHWRVDFVDAKEFERGT